MSIAVAMIELMRESFHEWMSGEVERLTVGDRVPLKELRKIPLLEKSLK